ncbi:MAG: type II toxin-antitoxin system RelE/ParE family toxin [gamma proteobacterium symbiont of Bathyaustriella thionipta]|nr:type II toxin-antitoxin system RelE/ParE family toxin [gamma proteobacterium symbiont of Bathyaustriella thionipta]
MIIYGANLGMPHTKSMKDGLFELRIKSKEGIGHAFYCTLVNRKIVILHAFIKNTQKTPAKDLKLGISRMKEVNSNANT